MPCRPRRFARITKFLLAGVTVFCVSWIASISEWNAGVGWSSRQGGTGGGLPTMKTIVAYSEGKQAEMDRPSPVTCDRLPAFPDIPIINRTWSPGMNVESTWQHVQGTQISLYAAFYDERLPQRYVRIIAKFQGRNFSSEVPLFCQTRLLNSNEDSVEVVAAKPLEIWWHEWNLGFEDVETPLLLSCPRTEPLHQPFIVSIVTQPCDDPTNAFTMEPLPAKSYDRNFTICVKDMSFDEGISQNLVEWIETNKLLGVEMIDMYVDRLTQESEKILLHYRDQGYVRLFNVPIKYKPERSLWQRRRDHILTYNDCLYRNIRQSEFVIPLDIDEIILPKVANTLHDLVGRLYHFGWDPSTKSAILIRNVFFFGFMQEIEKYQFKKMQTENKMYVKRDDVRIKTVENIDIALIGDTNRLNEEVIDIKEIDKDLYEMYESRCKKELRPPRLVKDVIRSSIVSPTGYYSKSMMLTRKVLTAFNHYPLTTLGSSAFAVWSAPFDAVQLNHYKESCNATLMPECTGYRLRARIDRAALRLRRALTTALANSICFGINDT